MLSKKLISCFISKFLYKVINDHKMFSHRPELLQTTMIPVVINGNIALFVFVVESALELMAGNGDTHL